MAKNYEKKGLKNSGRIGKVSNSDFDQPGPVKNVVSSPADIKKDKGNSKAPVPKGSQNVKHKY